MSDTVGKITATQHLQNRIKACTVNIHQTPQKTPQGKLQLKSKFGYIIINQTDELEKLKVSVTFNDKERTEVSNHRIVCQNIYYVPCRKKLKHMVLTGTVC